jgi:hypothetical protein
MYFSPPSLPTHPPPHTSHITNTQPTGLPGSTTCSIQGNTRWCANPGDKCCDAENSAPLDATCCPNGKYVLAGQYCCVGGGYCLVGRTCEDCTPASVPAPWVYNAVPSVVRTTVVVQRTTIAPVAVPTSVRVVNEYYTFTIT